MSYCFNPSCPKPHSPGVGKFCLRCGHKLLLGDRYRMHRVIGKGAFGRTFFAKDEGRLSQPACAVKQFIAPSQPTKYTQAAANWFEKQALKLEEVGDRPHIPEVLAYFNQGEQQYLVTKFIEGQNLDRELFERGAFSEAKIRELLANMLPVLLVIHSRGIVHRDIKPENFIRASANQELFLVDFGNADLIASDRGHIAPEQTKGKTTFASDIYGLGSSCIELATNIKPEQWRGRPRLLDEFLEPLTSDLAALLKAMVEADLNQRYASARFILRDLHSPPAKLLVPLTSSSPSSEKDPLQQAWECDRTIRVPEVFAGVKTVAVNPQGNIIASCSEDHIVKTWDSQSFRELQAFIGHNALIRQAIFTPDGKYLLTASSDRAIRQWDVETARTERIFTGHSQEVSCIAFSAARNLLASGSLDRQIKLWDWQTGQETRTLSNHTNYIRALAFSPDDRLLASCSDDRTCKLWEIGTGEQIGNFIASQWLQSLAFSPDGSLIAGGTVSNQILVWDVPNAKLSFTLSGHQGIIAGIESLAFSPDGQILASAGAEDKTIKLWHVKTQSLIATLSGHTAGVSAIAFSPDGKMLVSGSYDKSIKVWRS